MGENMRTEKEQKTDNEIEATFHSDGGHGWLQIPKQVYLAVGYLASDCSYQDDEFVYLEEDCDASRFKRKASKQGLILKVTYKRHIGNCFIRLKNRLSGVGFEELKS
jgi:hypothetical protein